MSILTEGNIRLVFSIIVVITLFLILVRFRVTKGEQRGSLDILKERLEKGEITEEAYLEACSKQKRKNHK